MYFCGFVGLLICSGFRIVLLFGVVGLGFVVVVVLVFCGDCYGGVISV